jgi:hypothetical protein
MAKSKAQVRTLLREMVLSRDRARAHLNDDLLVDYTSLKEEIEVGGPSEYMHLMQEALEDVARAANGYWQAWGALVATSAMMLGEYAGAADPTGSYAVSISKFNDKLIDNNEAVDSLGITVNAWSADGGNTGDGDIIEVTVDPNGTELEGGHNETLTLECVSIGVNGRKQWALSGNEAKRFLFDPNMGTGNSKRGYAFGWGAGVNDFVRTLGHIQTDEAPVLVEWSGSDHRNMVQNGNFEAPVGSAGSNDKIRGGTITSGESNIAIVTSGQIKGDQSMEMDGDGAIEFPIIDGGQVHLPLGFSIMLERQSTFTGTFTAKIIDAVGNTLDTITQDISALTAGAAVLKKGGFVVPATAQFPLHVELAVASSGGSGSVLVDELVVGRPSMFDSNRMLMKVAGPTEHVKGDKFTTSNSISIAGQIQRAMVELHGRSIEHASTGTYWTDS